MIDSLSCTTSAAPDSNSLSQFAARRPHTAYVGKLILGKRLRTTLATVAVMMTLSGCGVFCGGGGGSGGGFAGGCGTGVRF